MRLEELFSPENIQRMISDETVGDTWPYDGGTDFEVESHIRRVLAAIERLPGLIWEAEFFHYGSGYASYVDAFAHRRDGHGVCEHDGVREVVGLRVYISRVAPVCCIGRDEVTRHGAGGGFSFLTPSALDILPDDTWVDSVRAIRNVLVSNGYQILSSEFAARVLPFQTKIPTILDEGPYRYFDAAFFWED